MAGSAFWLPKYVPERSRARPTCRFTLQTTSVLVITVAGVRMARLAAMQPTASSSTAMNYPRADLSQRRPHFHEQNDQSHNQQGVPDHVEWASHFCRERWREIHQRYA